MAIETTATIDHPEGERLCHLHSVDCDLASVIELCDSFVMQAEASPHGIFYGELADVYTVTILVRFMRAMGGGVRHLGGFTQEERDSLAPELRTALRYFHDLRDKHIAHSVNAFEQTTVYFSYIAGQEEQAVVTGIWTGGHRLVGLSGKQLHEMKQLCLALRSIIADKIEVEKTRLLSILQSVGASRWTGRGARGTSPLDHSKVDQPRKRG